MWKTLRQYLNGRQIALLAITLFVLPFWLLNYESILQATGLDKVFVTPEGRFMTAMHAIVDFIQSDLAKGLLAGGLIVAFGPLLWRLLHYLLWRSRDIKTPHAADEEAQHALKLFVTDYVLPLGLAQRDLQIAIMENSCANRAAIDLATHSLLTNWAVRGFGDNFDHLWAAYSSSPESPVPFDEVKKRVLALDKNYQAMISQTERLAQDAGIDYRSHPTTKEFWQKCLFHHNELVKAYWSVKRDRRFGQLCRPGINGPWTERIPGN